MKLFKIITFTLLPIFIISVIYFSLDNKKISYNPISSQNEFYSNLTLALNTAKINPSMFVIRDFNNEVEFYLTDDDNHVKILLSNQKDPFWQVTTLQQVVKTAKMNQGKLKLVDLSSKHPYVTFKNN